MNATTVVDDDAELYCADGVSVTNVPVLLVALSEFNFPLADAYIFDVVKPVVVTLLHVKLAEAPDASELVFFVSPLNVAYIVPAEASSL